MTGKERILNTINLIETDRIPWVPFVGCHGGDLIGVNATEYLKSADNIVSGVSAAIERYNPDGIPVMFDLQVEAEALGCSLVWAEENPPAVVSHPLANGTTLESLKVPSKEDGRISVAIDAAKILRSKYPDVGLYGLITGPFTLALHLLGTDIFMKIFEDPEYVKRLMEFAKRVAIHMADYLIEAGCDIIGVVDPMTSQIDPDTFKSVVTPGAKDIFNHIREKGAKGSFFVCGHAQQNIEVMCQCKPDNISIDENIPLDYVKDVALKYKISFGGNIKLTVKLLMGSAEEAQKDALECMDLGGRKGFILAPGCDLPMKTPPQNIEAVTKLVHDPYQQDITRTLESSGSELDILNMKDYGQTDKVIVDIITLDSESCAPCQYMVEAVKKVAPHFEGIVEWREHAIKKMESVSFMASLMVKNIPTICIDGKIAFVSKIPPKNDLIASIQKRINEKLRLKISAKRGEITILYKEGDNYSELEQRIKTAILETGEKIDVKYVNDQNVISSFGVINTPAVVVTEFKTKTDGSTPSVDVIKEWIKNI